MQSLVTFAATEHSAERLLTTTSRSRAAIIETRKRKQASPFSPLTEDSNIIAIKEAATIGKGQPSTLEGRGMQQKVKEVTTLI